MPSSCDGELTVNGGRKPCANPAAANKSILFQYITLNIEVRGGSPVRPHLAENWATINDCLGFHQRATM
jgi:hypothetical protein